MKGHRDPSDISCVEKNGKSRCAAGMCVKESAGFHFFDRGTALFEKDTVTTVGAPDVDVYFNLLLTPCTFISTCHIQSGIIL